MQKQDVIPIHYFESPDRFADLINGYVYHGEERIRPENVREKSSSVARIAPKKKGGKEIQTQVITADIVREVGGDMRVSVVALESQTDIHYAMPVRYRSTTHHLVAWICGFRVKLCRVDGFFHHQFSSQTRFIDL